jgi:hypothetical protein
MFVTPVWFPEIPCGLEADPRVVLLLKRPVLRQRRLRSRGLLLADDGGVMSLPRPRPNTVVDLVRSGSCCAARGDHAAHGSRDEVSAGGAS